MKIKIKGLPGLTQGYEYVLVLGILGTVKYIYQKQRYRRSIRPRKARCRLVRKRQVPELKQSEVAQASREAVKRVEGKCRAPYSKYIRLY